MPRVFLTARWTDLCLVSYAVPSEWLGPLLPTGTEPDRTLDGRCYVSLVAFDFRDTRVFGVRWPGCVNFPEINLRFYVRETSAAAGQDRPRRGVCFVRELVPQRTVSAIARLWYHEPYKRATMTLSVRDEPTGDGSRRTISHRAEINGGVIELRAESHSEGRTPPPGSPEHWFKEHEWGFGIARSGRVRCYRVEHPVWRTREVASLDLRVDWARVYGPRWAPLAERRPDSVVLAEGSEVSVFHPE